MTSRKQPSKMGGLNIFILKDYLEMLRTETYYMKIFRKGKLRFKAGFIKYLKWLKDNGFVSHRLDYYVKVWKGETMITKKKSCADPRSFYKITDKGIKFLELLQ